MLHSPFPQSPITSNPSSSGSATMRTKGSSIDGEPSGEQDDDDSSRKRWNFAGEASISGEKVVAASTTKHEKHGEAAVAIEVGGGESPGLRLLGLLLQCTECVAIDSLDDATDLLPEISDIQAGIAVRIVKLASQFGSSAERVAVYVAEALQSRRISSRLGTYCSPPITVKALTLSHSHKIFNALQYYNSIRHLIKFSDFTANLAIFRPCTARIGSTSSTLTLCRAFSGQDCSIS